MKNSQEMKQENTAQFSIFNLDKQEYVSLLKMLEKDNSFCQFQKIYTSSMDDPINDRLWNYLIKDGKYIAFNKTSFDLLSDYMQEIHRAFNLKDNKNKGPNLLKAVFILKNKKSDLDSLIIAKELCMIVAGDTETDDDSRAQAIFLLAEMAIDENNLLLGFEYSIYYLSCSLSNLQKLNYSLSMIKKHMEAWGKRHPGKTHALIEMIENFPQEIYKNRAMIRDEILGDAKSKASITEKHFYKICYMKVILTLFINETKDNGNLEKKEKNTDDQPILPEQEISAFYIQLNDPEIRQFLIEQIYTEFPSRYAIFKSELIIFVRKWSVKTRRDLNNAELSKKNDSLIFPAAKNEENQWEISQADVGYYVKTTKTLLTLCMSKFKEGTFQAKKTPIIPSVTMSLCQLSNFFNLISVILQEAITHKLREKTYKQAIKNLQADDQLPELKIEIDDTTNQEIHSSSSIPTTPTPTPPKSIHRAISKGERDVLRLFWKKYDATRQSFGSSYSTYGFPAEGDARRSSIYLNDIIIHAMKNPVDSKTNKGGNRTAKILHDLFGVSLDNVGGNVELPEKKKMATGAGFGLIANVGKQAGAELVRGAFKKICEEDQTVLSEFHSKYNAKLKGKRLSFPSHTENKKKTLVRIIEETRNAYSFSFGFFSTCKRSREVFSEMGIDTRGEWSSEQLRTDLVPASTKNYFS